MYDFVAFLLASPLFVVVYAPFGRASARFNSPWIRVLISGLGWLTAGGTLFAAVPVLKVLLGHPGKLTLVESIQENVPFIVMMAILSPLGERANELERSRGERITAKRLPTLILYGFAGAIALVFVAGLLTR